MEFLSFPPGEQERLDDSLKMLLRGELVDDISINTPSPGAA
jgi:hypothetical protein